MRFPNSISVTAWVVAFACSVSHGYAQSREEKVRSDRERVVADGFWIYNDIPGAMSKARESGKPVLVVLRCIPCEECVKLDDELVDKDPEIRPLLERFVCVRQVSTNGLDLALFQYDTDQSFAVFMLNADGTIYGRFGTRSHRTEWLTDVSLKGLAAALKGALALHAEYPARKSELEKKRGKPPEVASPELFPTLKDRYTDRLNYAGDVVDSCIHCHQIGEARRSYYWSQRKPIPERILFPYPHPKSVGLIMDPDTKATIKSVANDSFAAEAGFRAGDQIVMFAGQPLLSIADLQWALDQVDPAGEEIAVKVKRAAGTTDLTFTLTDGWRRSGDLSWRASTWSLRRMVTGGMVLSADEAAATPNGPMALQVKHLGRFGPHAAAKKAGFKKGDVIVSFDGRQDLVTEEALLHHAISHHHPGAKVPVTVLRGGQRKSLDLPIQE